MTEHPGGTPVTAARPAAENAADTLRSAILDGRFGPGSHLDESGLAAELGVSRNTLREAFRVLAHERLIEHQPHRGVFVRTVSPEEARYVYEARRHLECGVLRELAVAQAAGKRLDPAGVEAAEDAVRLSEAARAAGDWATAGRANASFHLALVALGGNPIIDRVMMALTTEVRLLFLGIDDAEAVHARYVDENRRLLELVRSGHVARAAAAMELYLLEAERHLLP